MVEENTLESEKEGSEEQEFDFNEFFPASSKKNTKIASKTNDKTKDKIKTETQSEEKSDSESESTSNSDSDTTSENNEEEMNEEKEEEEEEEEVEGKKEEKGKKKDKKDDSTRITLSHREKQSMNTSKTSKSANVSKKNNENGIWIGNLNFMTSADSLRKLFEPCGKITRLNLPKNGKQNKGYS